MTYTLLRAMIPVLSVLSVWDLQSCDLMVTPERIRIECSNTLLLMKSPVRDRKCSHGFEKTAILDSITMNEESVAGKPVAKRSKYRLLSIRGKIDAYLSPFSCRRNVQTIHKRVLGLKSVPQALAARVSRSSVHRNQLQHCRISVLAESFRSFSNRLARIKLD